MKLVTDAFTKLQMTLQTNANENRIEKNDGQKNVSYRLSFEFIGRSVTAKHMQTN